MLKLTFSLLILIAFSCNTSQNSVKENAEKTTACPPDVECTAEILFDQTMVLKEDTIGQLYFQFEEKEGSHIVKHAYIKKDRPEIADDGYSEVVFFEIDDDTKRLDIEGEALKKHNLIVQKGCFCPGAGNELITDGTLKVDRTKKGYAVSISYNSDKQLQLNQLNFTVQRKP